MTRNLFRRDALVPPTMPTIGSGLTLALALSLWGAQVQALGLGGLRVQSALNQPFSGEIALLDVKPDELDTIKAQIAPVAEFSKAGAERFNYLTKLRFTPQISPRGDTVIRVSSREPIREPYMDFLVEVVWPKGRLVRAYTILLDPPVTAEHSAPRVEQPVAAPRRVAAAPAGAESQAPAPRPRVAAPPKPRPAATTDTTETAEAPPPAPRPSAPAKSGGFPKRIGPVRSGTGLWRLALNNTPMGATVAQTALALYRNNQGAFIGGDIDRLIVGKTLTIPSAAELFALKPEAAQREFKSALAGEKVRRTPVADPNATEVADGSGDSRLKIAGRAPEPKTAGGQTAAAGADGAPGTVSEGMEEELLLVREASESTRQETVELRDRIRELESQLGDIQRLLQLRNAELARIQGGVPPVSDQPVLAGGPAAQPAGTITEPVASEPAPLPPDVQAALDRAGGGDPISSVPPDQVAVAVPPLTAPATTDGPAASAPPMATKPPIPPVPSLAPASPPKIADAGTVAEPTADSTWQDVLLPLAALAGVTALGIGALSWVRSRRRRPVDGDSIETDFFDLSYESSRSDAHVAAGLPPGRAVATDSEEASTGAVLAHSAAEAALAPDDRGTDEADVISEADIYIAYGRYREAEELLREGMRRSPDRLDLRFKLADAYFSAKNVPALRALVQELRGVGANASNPEQWQRLTDMVSAAETNERADSPVTPTLVRAADPRDLAPRVPERPLVDLRPSLAELDSAEAFSLDVSDVDRPSADLALNAGAPDSIILALDQPRLSRPPSQPAPRAADLRPRSASPILEDDVPLLLDEDAFTRSLGLDPRSEGLVPSPPFSGSPAQEFSGSVSDLELNIDDLHSVAELDLDPLVESTQVSRRLLKEPDLPAGRGPNPLAAAGGDEWLGRADPFVPAEAEDGASGDLLGSHWQSDSGLWDEVATKLDLARAYAEMGDADSARTIIEEVMGEGNEAQRTEAAALLKAVG